jgi:hypothetical protein
MMTASKTLALTVCALVLLASIATFVLVLVTDGNPSLKVTSCVLAVCALLLAQPVARHGFRP